MLISEKNIPFKHISKRCQKVLNYTLKHQCFFDCGYRKSQLTHQMKVDCLAGSIQQGELPSALWLNPSALVRTWHLKISTYWKYWFITFFGWCGQRRLQEMSRNDISPLWFDEFISKTRCLKSDLQENPKLNWVHLWCWRCRKFTTRHLRCCCSFWSA